MKKLIASVLCLSAIATGFAGPAEQADIAQLAAGTGKFKTLLSVAEKAGIVADLKSTGPNTLFAPTDKAFAKIPSKVLNAIVESPVLLKEILLYHVVGADVNYGSVDRDVRVPTLSGYAIRLGNKKKQLTANGNKVTASFRASNGVIHVLDTVLVPPHLAAKIKSLAK